VDIDGVQGVIDRIKDLWPRWQNAPLGEERVFWIDELRPLYYDRAIQAIDGCKRRLKFPPTLADILNEYGRTARPAAGQTESPPPGSTGMWVLCVKGERLGWHHELTYPTVDAIPAEHVVAQALESWRQRRTELYGGEWLAYPSATAAQMAELARQAKAGTLEVDYGV